MGFRYIGVCLRGKAASLIYKKRACRWGVLKGHLNCFRLGKQPTLVGWRLCRTKIGSTEYTLLIK